MGTTTIVVAGLSLLLSNSYRSTAIVLPDNDAAKLGGVGGLADLASMAGISVGGAKSMVDLYPQILTSEAILHSVIVQRYYSEEVKDSINLIQYFKFHEDDPRKNYDLTMQAFLKVLEVAGDKKTKVVTVSLVMTDSRMAADVVNTIVGNLDTFIRTKRISTASERRKWIEQRLIAVKGSLTDAENGLKDFRERNRVITSSPQLLLEQQRLIREVEINSTVFIELKKQLELAKIDEINTMPIVNVLDAARSTTIKEGPRRSIIVIVFFLFTAAVTCGWVVVNSLFGEEVERFRQRFRSMRQP